jgi:hypothetical protein
VEFQKAERWLSLEIVQGKGCLPGFPHPLEGRRRRHSDPRASQSRIRQAAVIPQSLTSASR